MHRFWLDSFWIVIGICPLGCVLVSLCLVNKPVFRPCDVLEKNSAASVVKREAGSTPLEDIQKHAAEFQKTFTEQFNAIVASKDSQAVQKAVKDGSDSLGDASGKAKEALEQARAGLEKTVGELRAAHPEVEQHAGELKNKLQAAVQNAVQESQKLAKEISANLEQTNEKLAPALKAAYDDFVKHAEDVRKNVHDAANKQ
ncbi:Apolipophorin III [Operophtera brumata]|uniref:Apolipophorin III n=1 Tax=Operophtera brumata TaxID=104452 RepID=A0A0L7KQD5_OPEBR|nr:Apolipophorin III [Operophtera brumata]